MSALVVLDTGGSGVVSSDRKECVPMPIVAPRAFGCNGTRGSFEGLKVESLEVGSTHLSTPPSGMAIWGTHPAVFVRMANKGDRPGQRTGRDERPGRARAPPRRLFFVSVI